MKYWPLNKAITESEFTKPIAKQQSGFTILELMIATMVFSVILLLCTVGLLQIGKIYFKGITSSRTQEAARSIIDEISRGVQFSGGTVVTIQAEPPASVPPPPSPLTSQGLYYFCINDKLYSYVIDMQVDPSVSSPTGDKNKFGLVSFPQSCSTVTGPLPIKDPGYVLPSGAKELLGEKMHLADLSITLASGSKDLYQITINIGSGDLDLFDASSDNHGRCSSGAGGQFCAISQLTTVVQKRVQ